MITHTFPASNIQDARTKIVEIFRSVVPDANERPGWRVTFNMEGVAMGGGSVVPHVWMVEVVFDPPDDGDDILP